MTPQPDSEVQPDAEPRPEIVRAPATALVLGLVAGAVSALLGVSAGILLGPAMIHLLRIRKNRAVGTSMMVLIPVAVVAALQYHQEARHRDLPGIELGAVILLVLGGVAGAVVGAPLARKLGGRQLGVPAGLFLLLLAGFLAAGGLSGADAGVVRAAERSAALVFVCGMAAGCASSLFQASGGVMTVAALVLLLGWDQHAAQGTSLAVLIPASSIAALVYLFGDNIVWSLALWQAVGAIAAASWVGGNVHNVPPSVLRLLFAGFLALMGIAALRRRPAAPEEEAHAESPADEPPPAESP